MGESGFMPESLMKEMLTVTRGRSEVEEGGRRDEDERERERERRERKRSRFIDGKQSFHFLQKVKTG